MTNYPHIDSGYLCQHPEHADNPCFECEHCWDWIRPEDKDETCTTRERMAEEGEEDWNW